jgi:hypothetical protein
MSPDVVNGLFECIGALVLSINVRQLLKDKVLRGVHIAPTVFYTLWGVWNLYYYPTLDQWFSFAGGVAVVLVNAAWVILAVYYARRNA